LSPAKKKIFDRCSSILPHLAIPTTALAVTTETFRDWASPLAGPASQVIYWYFDEVGNHTDQVGVAEAEKRAAAAALSGAH